jgi:hypothetical protein
MICTHIRTIKKLDYHYKGIPYNNEHDKKQIEYEITDRYTLCL